MDNQKETNWLETFKKPLRLYGTFSSFQAWMISTWHAHHSRPVIVVCPTSDDAEKIAQDLECFQKSQEVFIFPTWERSPYGTTALSLKTRFQRIRTLSRLQKKETNFIVTTLAAAQQYTLPPSWFETLKLHLKKEEEYSFQDILNQLNILGYQRIDPVEDPGTFAVRGDILDIFPPDCFYPKRLDFFGNQLEKIRSFDPGTQRTLAHLGEDLELDVSPAREVLILKENKNRLKAEIKKHADEFGISRRFRDPIAEQIEQQIYPDHSDAWSHFAYEKKSTFWDYLPKNAKIFWQDEPSCIYQFNEFLKTQSKQNAQKSQVILPEVDQLYESTVKREALLLKTAFFFEKIELKTNENGLLDGEHVRLNISENINVKHHFTETVKNLLESNFRIEIYATSPSRLDKIKFQLKDLESQSGIHFRLGSITKGFTWPDKKITLFGDHEILGSHHTKKTSSSLHPKSWSGLQSLADLSNEDLVVHLQHGIGRYKGLKRIEVSGAINEFLVVEYSNQDKLYLPVYRLNLIQKYHGGGTDSTLDRLGSKQFEKTKTKVREAVKKLAIDLVDLYAKRNLQTGFAFHLRDSSYRDFEDRFPFTETSDQANAIEETLSDLESGRIVDRLICGDVGFGKTEVAMRAAFQAVQSGKQVAILVPTTVLAQQHENTLIARFSDQPIRIESISRFKSKSEQKNILEDLSSGKIDIIVGTHRLLSKDVRFHSLGLIVVDEEHRFGVEHKERLKTLKLNTHVLTLTATPIPRTLHMALSGMRDISLMTTPPVDRLPIRTYVSQFNEVLIQEALQFEFDRGGQSFFLHNRVDTLHQIAASIQGLLKKAKIQIAHGKMKERELEKIMLAFYRKEIDILVCTTIIESGLDIPNCNTIIINEADRFGLAQLYQLRGRVGRSERRAYCYLLISHQNALTAEAQKRLEVIQRFVELGSGFNIASHDLEIRGGGSLLGAQQSGHVAAVGFDLYTDLLQEAMDDIRGRLPSETENLEPEIKVPFSAYLDESFIPDVHQRLSLYRKLSSAQTEDRLDELESEMCDRFGKLPKEAENLLWICRTKLLLAKNAILSVNAGPKGVSLAISPQTSVQKELSPELAKDIEVDKNHQILLRQSIGSAKKLYFTLVQLFPNLPQNSKS